MRVETLNPPIGQPIKRFPPAAWWLLAILAALVLDGPIAHAVQPIAIHIKHAEAAQEIKEVGHFAFLLIVAAFVWILHPTRWRGAAVLVLSGVFAGTLYGVLKWPIGRPRPDQFINPFHFEPFYKGWAGLFQGGTSFPSGHTCLAFATAACMSWLLPRGRWAFFVAAGLVGAERVLELAHYLSDVVVGAGLGIAAFHMARYTYVALVEPRFAHPLSRAVVAS